MLHTIHCDIAFKSFKQQLNIDLNWETFFRLKIVITVNSDLFRLVFYFTFKCSGCASVYIYICVCVCAFVSHTWFMVMNVLAFV